MLGLAQTVSLISMCLLVLLNDIVYFTSVGPRVSENNTATVIIEENDDAHGVVEFGATVFNGTEGQSNFIYLRRLAGTFGEVYSKIMFTIMVTSSSSSSGDGVMADTAQHC